jgi:hypothetical protein
MLHIGAYFGMPSRDFMACDWPNAKLTHDEQRRAARRDNSH